MSVNFCAFECVDPLMLTQSFKTRLAGQGRNPHFALLLSRITGKKSPIESNSDILVNNIDFNLSPIR